MSNSNYNDIDRFEVTIIPYEGNIKFDLKKSIFSDLTVVVLDGCYARIRTDITGDSVKSVCKKFYLKLNNLTLGFIDIIENDLQQTLEFDIKTFKNGIIFGKNMFERTGNELYTLSIVAIDRKGNIFNVID